MARTFVALYDFIDFHPGELRFQKGDELVSQDESTGDWGPLRAADGREGLCSMNYVLAKEQLSPRIAVALSDFCFSEKDFLSIEVGQVLVAVSPTDNGQEWRLFQNRFGEQGLVMMKHVSVQKAFPESSSALVALRKILPFDPFDTSQDLTDVYSKLGSGVPGLWESYFFHFFGLQQHPRLCKKFGFKSRVINFIPQYCARAVGRTADSWPWIDLAKKISSFWKDLNCRATVRFLHCLDRQLETTEYRDFAGSRVIESVSDAIEALISDCHAIEFRQQQLRILVTEYHPVEPWRKFRLFVLRNHVTACSQLLGDMHFPQLDGRHLDIRAAMISFELNLCDVPKKLPAAFVCDVWLLEDNQIKILEVRLFHWSILSLFDWGRDKQILLSGDCVVRTTLQE